MLQISLGALYGLKIHLFIWAGGKGRGRGREPDSQLNSEPNSSLKFMNPHSWANDGSQN